MSHHGFVVAVRGLLVATLLGWVASAAWAGPYSGLVVFGDSLSDVGNAWVLSNYAYPPPNSGYDGGRFSNGPIWLEDLAPVLGVTAPGSFFYMSNGSIAYGGANNLNFAIGGQTTQDMKNQGDTYVQYMNGHADPAALDVVWGGANDLFDALGSNPTTTQITACDNSVATYAGNIAGLINTLHAAGAVSFLVPNLPPLGSTPRFNTNPYSAAINSVTRDFNADLSADLLAIENADPDVNIHTMDVYSLFNQVVANPSSYGFNNVTDPAISTPGADPSRYMFWDTIHPTAAGHALLAEAAAQSLGVPEPSMWALLAVGTLAWLTAGLRRQHVHFNRSRNADKAA